MVDVKTVPLSRSSSVRMSTNDSKCFPDENLSVASGSASAASASNQTPRTHNNQQSLQQSSSMSQYSGISGITDYSAGGTARKLSPLGIVVKKCSRELQAVPPLSEKRSLLILQSLLNVLETKATSVMPDHPLMSQADKDAASVLSHRKQSKLIAIDSGALPAITSVMKTYKDSAKLQSKAVLLLGTLGEDYPEQLANSHGAGYILAVLCHSKHCKSESLCYDACSSLAKICGCEDDFDELCPLSLPNQRNLSQVAHGDGIKTLQKVMKIHLKHHGIQQRAIQILCSIATNEEDDEKYLQQILEDPDLIETLVAVMNKHKKLKTVQHIGNTLIYLLATKGSQRTKSSLVWSHAVSAVLKAMSMNTLVPTVQLEACEALYAMAMERPEARSTISEEGSVLILDAMKAHPNHSPIQHSACQLLAILCEHPTTSKYIASAIDKQPNYRSVLSWAQAGHKEHSDCTILVSKILNAYDNHTQD